MNIRTGGLVLAAGKGTRMNMEDPKVLVTLAQEPVLSHVYAALEPVFGTSIWTIVGYKADRVEESFPEFADTMILQAEQLGTGHAVQCGWDSIVASGVDYVAVINGDTPLLQTSHIQTLIQQSQAEQSDVAFLTLQLEDPGSFGRVVRKDGEVMGIIEAKDYDESVYGPATGEINSGIYCLKVDSVSPLLDKLHNNNKSGEYYVTDLIELARNNGLIVTGITCGNDATLLGINSPAELVEAEELYYAVRARKLLEKGVMVRNFTQVRVGRSVTIEPGAEVVGPCEIHGTTTIARGAVIRSHCVLNNVQIAAGCVIKEFSHLEDAVVREGASVGPYGRLRPGADVGENARVGNFVEIKKSILHAGAKASHLTYLGDAEIGKDVNIGAGTITCNYDGKNKFKTVIAERAFIGSNTALVAPVTVGPKALVGAGSVITKDVGESQLAIARGRQKNIDRKRDT